MNRITKKDLENQVALINRLTGHPEEVTGHAIAGQYILAGAFGGNKLEQICKDGHGTNDITSGYDTKRDLYNKMSAIITGLSMKKG